MSKPDSHAWMISKQKEYCIAGSAVITAITSDVYKANGFKPRFRLDEINDLTVWQFLFQPSYIKIFDKTDLSSVITYFNQKKIMLQRESWA